MHYKLKKTMENGKQQILKNIQKTEQYMQDYGMEQMQEKKYINL